MTLLLIDADAFISARKFELLGLARGEQMPRPALWMTSRVARNELNSLAQEVTSLEEAGVLYVKQIMVRTPEALRARELRKDEGADRGEAELLAWATTELDGQVLKFISCDKRARQLAEKLGVPRGDVLDLAIYWYQLGFVTLNELEERFAPWEDAEPGSLWRPSDFTTTRETIETRVEAQPPGDR